MAKNLVLKKKKKKKKKKSKGKGRNTTYEKEKKYMLLESKVTKVHISKKQLSSQEYLEERKVAYTV